MILQIHAVDTVTLLSPPRLRRRNIEFYRDLLKLPLDADRCDARTLVFSLHQRDLRVAQEEPAEVNRHAVRASFQVEHLSDIFRDLNEAGWAPELYLGCSVATRRVFVFDPTGYRIELFQLWPLF